MKYKNKEGYSILLGKEECDICIEALEKQVAKKPKIIYEHIEDNGLYDLSFMCLSCDMNIIGQYYRPSYCKLCGQKLDWSEVIDGNEN
jgi:hypothetical protein